MTVGGRITSACSPSLEAMITHDFGLTDAETAMRTSTSPASMKVTIVPGLGADS